MMRSPIGLNTVHPWFELGCGWAVEGVEYERTKHIMLRGNGRMRT